MAHILSSPETDIVAYALIYLFTISSLPTFHDTDSLTVIWPAFGQ